MKTVIQNIVAWFFSTFLVRVRKEIADVCREEARGQRIIFEENIRELLKAGRVPTYVTLRGRMVVEGKEVPHGWTQKINLPEGKSTSMTFAPYEPFICERVDVLGPAIIQGVSVGNRQQVHSEFSAPATVKFQATAEPGNLITVWLLGVE